MEVQLHDETKSFEVNSRYAFAVNSAVMLDTALLCGSNLETSDGTKLCSSRNKRRRTFYFKEDNYDILVLHVSLIATTAVHACFLINSCHDWFISISLK
jgi:hypothetical protein